VGGAMNALREDEIEARSARFAGSAVGRVGRLRRATYDGAGDGRKTTEKNVTLTLFLAVEIEIEIPIGVKFHYLSVKTLHNTVCFIKP